MSITNLQNCSVIDLFCGSGGLTHGLVLEGFQVIAGIDSDRACKFPYEHNNKAQFINKRIEDVTAEEINGLFPEGRTKILVGCAPCQPFSQYKRKKGASDNKWQLLTSFGNLIDEVQPQIVSMENVPELMTFSGGQVYKSFVERLSENYVVTAYTAFCPDYGIPQSRTRLVLFASKFGPIELAPGTHDRSHYKTVRDTINHLPPIAAGEVCAFDALHRASSLSDLNRRRIKQSKPGGTWRDWETSLVANCHQKTSGQSYDSVYGRMAWDRPAPTITTQCNGYGNGRFGHPEQDRAISMREAALLQTFPQSYQFVAPESAWYIETLARLIGNAVPVELARAIGKSINIHLEKANDREA